MPLIENTPDCPFVSRFTFERTQGPALGFKDIGIYYLLATGLPNTPGDLGLGIGGFSTFTPGRNFALEMQGLARSTPAPLQLGTTSEYNLSVQQLFYVGRNLWEVEDFIRAAPNNIGPYAGIIRLYKSDGVTLFKTYTNCFWAQEMQHSWDGAKNFVEYSLLFKTVEEPV